MQEGDIQDRFSNHASGTVSSEAGEGEEIGGQWSRKRDSSASAVGWSPHVNTELIRSGREQASHFSANHGGIAAGCWSSKVGCYWFSRFTLFELGGMYVKTFAKTSLVDRY